MKDKTIKIGSNVRYPVLDGDGIAEREGVLISINSRWAIVSTNGEEVRVGKTRVTEIAESPKHSRHYNCRAASGRKSLDNGDIVAISLRGKPLEYAYEIASGHLDISVTSLKAKYSHLNPGQQRMCLGNKLRKL